MTDQFYTITYQKETVSDPESFSIDLDLEDIEICQSSDPSEILTVIKKISDDLLYMHYLTVWSGDPEDWQSEILESVNLEESKIDPEIFICLYLPDLKTGENI